LNEATGVCIPISNSEVLLAAVYKSRGHAWNNEDANEILRFRHKQLLAEDLNTRQPFWNSVVSNPSCAKIRNLLNITEHEMLAPQRPTHYCHAGNFDVLGIVVHKNARLSKTIISDILDADCLPIISHLQDHVKIRNPSDSVDKFTE
jgi:hypothetical protein